LNRFHSFGCFCPSLPSRDVAFLSLGEIALAVGDAVLPHLPVIVDMIAKGLGKVTGSGRDEKKSGGVFSALSSSPATADDKLRRKTADMALLCIGMLARALGDKLVPHAAALVEQMFQVPLCPALIESLEELTTSLPHLLPVVQERLLEAIANVLALITTPTGTGSGAQDTPERVPIFGAPSSHLFPAGRRLLPPAERKKLKGADAKQETALIVLALRTLGSFNFDSEADRVVSLLRDCLLSYLDYEHPTIRKEAATTCTRLLPRLAETIRYGAGTHLVFEVLKRLAVVAVADTVPSIRLAVLSSFDPRLDRYLAQAEILNTLFVALNDEVFAVREAAVTLLGRLSVRNPALSYTNSLATLWTKKRAVAC